MLASAVAAIERHALPARLAAERQHREACDALERTLAEVEQRIPWWERVAFFHDAPDELTARTLGAELAAARAALERSSAELATAVAAAGAESPPVELGLRIDRVIRETLADGRVARLAAAGKPVALELEALAERTLELFTADFDASATVAALVDPAARRALASRAGRPPARDGRLGWAPATGEQIGAWAARALDGPALGTALAVLARERSECDAAARALAAARSRVTAWEALAPGKSSSELAVDAVAGHLAREQAEAVSAAASVAMRIEASLATYPPVGVAEQALAAAAILRCLRPRHDDALSPDGERVVTAAADVRATFLAALVELERAFALAFPGLMARLSPRAAPGRAAPRGDEAPPARAEPLPYRVAGGAPPALSALPASAREDAERVLRDDLTRAGMRPRLEQLLAHGLMVAAARRATRGAERRIRFADRLAFWSSSPDEAEANELGARERWHQAVLDAQRDAALSTLGSITWNHPELAYQRSLRAAHAWLEAVSTYGGSSAPSVCPVHHRIEVLQALDATLAQFGRCFGLQGQLGDLAGAVLAHLRSTPPPRAAPPPPGPRRLAWDQVVLLVAETLRPTDFVARDHAIAAAAAARSAASADATEAAATVTFWDKVNVFTKSPAERRRDAKSAEATTEAGRLAAMMGQATGLLFDAMRAYPPAGLYYGLIEARAAVAAIRAERRTHTSTTGTGSSRVTTTHHICALVGKEAALRRLRGWTRDMVRALGATPTDSELLARWVATALA